MSVVNKTIWNVRSAEIGGAWNLDALGGLRNGVIYIDKPSYNGREPKTISLVDSNGIVTTAEALTGAEGAGFKITATEDYPGNLVRAVVEGEGAGLYAITAQYTETDPADVDAYTKAEVDAKVSTLNQAVNGKANSADVYTKAQADNAIKTVGDQKVAQGSVTKTTKATAGSSNAVTALATGATLEQAVTKINEIISTLNTVRSTAGSAYTVVNSVIDALTAGKAMPA